MILTAVLLLAGCVQEPPDLKKELADLAAGERDKVQPLPALRPIPGAAYTAGRLPDPFHPDSRPQ